MCGLLLVIAACGASKAKPETPPSNDVESPGSEESEAMPEDDPAEPKSSKKAAGAGAGNSQAYVPMDWQVGRADCEAMAHKYRALIRKVEMEKLEKQKVTAKVRPQAEKNVEQAVEKGVSNWLTACQEIVGTTQVRGRWDCAYKADSVDRFKGCMDGKFDTEFEK